MKETPEDFTFRWLCGGEPVGSMRKGCCNVSGKLGPQIQCSNLAKTCVVLRESGKDRRPHVISHTLSIAVRWWCVVQCCT